jgi:GDP-L-fucose synthase
MMTTGTTRPAEPLPKDTRIFLAGHRGLVGGAVLRGLRARGYERVLMRTHAELDLTDQSQTRAFFKQESPEVVIVAAARVGGIMANWEYPWEFVAENLAIELNAVGEAFRSGVRRLIFLGSSCIYPKLAPQPLREEYLLTGPLEETNRAYAIAKIAGIEMCRSLNREYGTDYLSLMPTNLYGPGDNFDLETSHLLPALIRKFHEAKVARAAAGLGPTNVPDGGPAVTLWGTGRPRREMLFVDDLADAVCLMLEGESWRDVPDGLLNVGTGQDATISELASIVAEVVGYDGVVHWDSARPDGTPQKLMDISRISDIGWRPTTNLRDGIARTYSWFLTNVAESGAGA